MLHPTEPQPADKRTASSYLIHRPSVSGQASDHFFLPAMCVRPAPLLAGKREGDLGMKRSGCDGSIAADFSNELLEAGLLPPTAIAQIYSSDGGLLNSPLEFVG